MNQPRSSRKQNGLSLIELLIAMIIGLFLLAGITTSYIQSKKTSIQRDEYSLLQDNGRLALEVMANTIEHTGYTSFPSAIIDPSSFITGAVTSKTCDVGGESVLDSTIFPAQSTKDGVSGASDSIGVTYMGDANVSTDCSGESLPVGCQIGSGNPDSAHIYSAFFLQNNELKCAGSRNAAVQTIADGIENMQFLYGVDADGDGVVDRYINSTQIGTFADNILSVQIAILVRSANEVKSSSESIKYSLLDEAITSPNDRYMRAVFTTTINLRNTL